MPTMQISKKGTEALLWIKEKNEYARPTLAEYEHAKENNFTFNLMIGTRVVATENEAIVLEVHIGDTWIDSDTDLMVNHVISASLTSSSLMVKRFELTPARKCNKFLDTSNFIMPTTFLGKVLHGSKLYRLDNPASDTDYKGVFLPALRDCVLFRAQHNSQSKEGTGSEKTEFEQFSLQDFLRFASNGEDVAITMLTAKDGDVIEDSEIFSYLRANRKMFYTKHMRGQMGYAKGQALKYCLRADRMECVEKVIAVLEGIQKRGVTRLLQCWDELPDGQHIRRYVSDNNRDSLDKRVYEVVGKGLSATISPEYALEILRNTRESYGARVKNAKAMGGKDMKAISHSFRVGYQLKHIFEDGDFSFPLPETDLIRAVKEGRLNYVGDKLDEKLNDLMSKVEDLSEKSNLPNKVDHNFVDQIVLKAYNF